MAHICQKIAFRLGGLLRLFLGFQQLFLSFFVTSMLILLVALVFYYQYAYERFRLGINEEIVQLLNSEASLFERGYLIAQINRFGGNISKTASFVGMERSALHRKLKMLGVVTTARGGVRVAVAGEDDDEADLAVREG